MPVGEDAGDDCSRFGREERSERIAPFGTTFAGVNEESRTSGTEDVGVRSLKSELQLSQQRTFKSFMSDESFAFPGFPPRTRKMYGLIFCTSGRCGRFVAIERMGWD